MACDSYKVVLTEGSKNDLRRIKKKYGLKTYETIRDLILDLQTEPEKKGEPLRGKLTGLYSRHYSRYRIIFQLNNDSLIVYIVGCGWHTSGYHKDIYTLLERALDSGKIILLGESGRED